MEEPCSRPTTASLRNLLVQAASATDIEREAVPLYWVGDPNEKEPRS